MIFFASPPALGSKQNLWEYIHSGRLALPAVLPKVHHHPEVLYVPTEVNTRQVDGLARIPGLTEAPYKSHPQPPKNVQRFFTSDPLSTNTQGSLVPQVPTLKGIRVRERGRGQPMNNLVTRKRCLPTKQNRTCTTWTHIQESEKLWTRHRICSKTDLACTERKPRKNGCKNRFLSRVRSAVMRECEP